MSRYWLGLLVLWGVVACDSDPMMVGGPSFSVESLVWGNGRFVAGDANGAVLYSDDGRYWQAVSSGTLQPLSAMAWHGSGFIALGYAVLSLVSSEEADRQDALLHSTDGVTWTATAIPQGWEYERLVWNGSRFVAVGEAGQILFSDDGMSWQEGDNSVTGDAMLGGLLWDGGRFLAVGWGGWVIESPDGASWSGTRSLPEVALNGLAWSGSRYVAVGDGGRIFTSETGESWVERSSGVDDVLWDVAWGGGRFVAVGLAGRMLESADGITWQAMESGIGESLTRVVWGGDRFVIAGRNSSFLYYLPGESRVVRGEVEEVGAYF